MSYDNEQEMCCYCGKFDAQADGLCTRCYHRSFQ